MIPNCFIEERNPKNYCISNQKRSKVSASYFKCLWKTTILYIINSLPFACILFHKLITITLVLYRCVTLMMFCRTERSNFSQNSSIALRDLDVLLVTLSCSCLLEKIGCEMKYIYVCITAYIFGGLSFSQYFPDSNFCGYCVNRIVAT